MFQLYCIYVLDLVSDEIVVPMRHPKSLDHTFAKIVFGIFSINVIK